jgi:hypothetical protein
LRRYNQDELHRQGVLDAGFTDVTTKPLKSNICRQILAQHGHMLPQDKNTSQPRSPLRFAASAATAEEPGPFSSVDSRTLGSYAAAVAAATADAAAAPTTVATATIAASAAAAAAAAAAVAAVDDAEPTAAKSRPMSHLMSEPMLQIATPGNMGAPVRWSQQSTTQGEAVQVEPIKHTLNTP